MENQHPVTSELPNHAGFVLRICRKMMRSREDAEDCAQETLLSAHRSFQDFRGDSELESWLYTIAVRTCIGALEKRKKRHSAEYEDEDLDTVAADARLLPDYLAEANDLQQAAAASVCALESRKRAIIILKDMEGKSYREISRIVGLPVGTVRSSLSRTRRQIIEELRNKQYEV